VLFVVGREGALGRSNVGNVGGERWWGHGALVKVVEA
jgi:hypothetical protein